MKISRKCLTEVEAALERYREEVENTDMTPNSKGTYLRHAESFVRWLGDDFEPGGTLKRMTGLVRGIRG